MDRRLINDSQYASACSLLNDREAMLAPIYPKLIFRISNVKTTPSETAKAYFSADQIRRRMEEDRERVSPRMGSPNDSTNYSERAYG